MKPPTEVITAAEFAQRKYRVPHEFDLRFPARWQAQPVLNRYAAAIERETLGWLAGHGIGCTDEEARRLRQFNCGMYGGHSLPLADFERGLLVTQFITLWLFWDDMQVEQEVGWDIEEVVAALTGSRPIANFASRYVTAWADLGGRLRRTQSAAWMERLAATMRQWLANAKVETQMARAFRAGDVCPDFAALMACRTISSGMFPTFHLIEFAEGYELGEAFHGDRVVIEIKRLASRLVGMGNDLGGMARDLADRWLNLVVVSERRSQLTLAEAFAYVVGIHNADVQELDRLAALLPERKLAQEELVLGWVQAVRHNVHGLALWEAKAERYQARKALVGGLALVAPVVQSAELEPPRAIEIERQRRRQRVVQARKRERSMAY